MYKTETCWRLKKKKSKLKSLLTELKTLGGQIFMDNLGYVACCSGEDFATLVLCRKFGSFGEIGVI